MTSSFLRDEFRGVETCEAAMQFESGAVVAQLALGDGVEGTHIGSGILGAGRDLSMWKCLGGTGSSYAQWILKVFIGIFVVLGVLGEVLRRSINTSERQEYAREYESSLNKTSAPVTDDKCRVQHSGDNNENSKFSCRSSTTTWVEIRNEEELMEFVEKHRISSAWTFAMTSLFISIAITIVVVQMHSWSMRAKIMKPTALIANAGVRSFIHG